MSRRYEEGVGILLRGGFENQSMPRTSGDSSNTLFRMKEIRKVSMESVGHIIRNMIVELGVEELYQGLDFCNLGLGLAVVHVT